MPISILLPGIKTCRDDTITYDRELFAIYLAIKLFRYFLEGREFHIQTDHKFLIYALSSRLDGHSPRQIRHLDFISQFTSDLRCVPGSANTAADALSHSSANALHVGTSSPVVDFHELALAQTDDPKLAKLLAYSSLHFERVPLALSKSFAMCPLAFSEHMYRSVSAELFSMLSTTSLILEYMQSKGL